MAETQTYSHSDIQRYLQQRMSPQEMHEFEKALMNDPFLADALEGFSASDTRLAEEHISAIERAITGDEQKAKVVYLSIKKTAWWKVAAIILVIVSAGFLTYSVINNQGTRDPGKSKIAVIESKTAIPAKDSVGPADKPLARLEGLQQKQLPIPTYNPPIIHSAPNNPMASSKPIYHESNEMLDTIKASPPSIVAAPAPVSRDNQVTIGASAKQSNADMATSYSAPRKTDVRSVAAQALTSIQNEFKGKVVDKSGDPIPYADIRANNSSATAVSDAKGNFSLQARDSVVQVKVNSPGYVSTVSKIRSNKPDNRISLKEDELSLAEVVVTSLAKKKRSASANTKLDSTTAAEPVGGWKSFKQYLNHQLDSLKATEADPDFNEDIVLEFSINKQGQPTDIKAAAGVDKIMTEKAIQILSNGPRWKNKKKDKTVKVIIAF